jgi:phosphoribosyl 1,2-cyclic phosphodiesterase
MRFSILGSGSAGNSTILECGSVRILIDAGLSAKQLCLRLESLGIAPESI